MVWTEIILIVIGIIMIGASFYVTERLSEQDLDQISMMSKENLKRISEKLAEEMHHKVEDTLDDMIDESLTVVQRGLEKETNSKIMAVSEYSETVLDNINKSHNEITFLYSMLNDKQSETAQLIGDLQRITKQIREMNLDSTMKRLETAASYAMNIEKAFDPMAFPVVEANEETVINETTNLREFQDIPEETHMLSKNEQILLLYKEGKNEVEIARHLDCGLGEVRLVLGLYNNEA